MPCKRAPPARSPPGIPTERTRLQRARQPAPCPPPTVYHPPEPTRASGHHPALAVPAPSGGGPGWGRVCTPCERAPPARSPPGIPTERTRLQRARQPAPCPPPTVYHPPEPTHASGHHPAPRVPAPSEGGVEWGAMPCERAPPARSSPDIPTGSARLRRAPHRHQLTPAGATSGTGSSRPQRGRARVGAIPWERTPPVHSSPAPACTGGSLIRHR